MVSKVTYRYTYRFHSLSGENLKIKKKKSSLCYRFKPQPLSPFYLVHYSTQNAFSATKNKNKTKKFFKKKDQKKKPKSKAPTRKNKTWGRD